MSVRARRHLASAEGEEGPDERWMASYLDMITVLMCMFIVLFAMSTVDKEKFEQLSASLATGFGQDPSEVRDVSEGVVVPAELLEEDGAGFMQAEIDAAEAELDAAEAELDELTALRDRLRQALVEHDLADAATFTIDERGLTIGLVSAETYFATNSTQLTPEAVTLLDALGGVLVDVPNEISIEGHADQRSAVAPFATNWELSVGRSTQVLRHFVEVDGIDPGQIRSVGFGDARPAAEGSTEQAMAQNRRVDVVVLSSADEEVRRLLPDLQGAQPRF
ncbi:flagellar motor protein MotB [Microbacterium sp. CIAB417]|uniref:OmpA/MotB family protein n=1 Tax=Microbacterium sp. CIAB417 TaxID=2860287 RepID=UPI001FADC6C7|nr:flagellar motor protein MotB [Microbacterium sp. CIAB417]